MPRIIHLFRFLLIVVTASVGFDACAQSPEREPLYDPTQMPAIHGILERFIPTPAGDIEGFVLVDGTEVKTPPHLTAELAAIVKPGDRVTVHGLRAASLPLFQAMSVGNDATGAEVIDTGPQLGRHPPALPRWDASGPVRIDGQVRMPLHGLRGDLNGALLQDGTVLRLPPPEAKRFAAVLVPGMAVEARGLRRTTLYGPFIDLTALGPRGGPLTPLPERSDAASPPPPPAPDR